MGDFFIHHSFVSEGLQFCYKALMKKPLNTLLLNFPLCKWDSYKLL
jgi:hypothetical protein